MNLNKRGYSRIAELDNIKVKIQGDNLKIFTFTIQSRCLVAD